MLEKSLITRLVKIKSLKLNSVFSSVSCVPRLLPTKRALDGGYAARFWAGFVALGFFRFDRESPLPPTASNADRWAVP
jgi:hypothetical protein